MAATATTPSTTADPALAGSPSPWCRPAPTRAARRLPRGGSSCRRYRVAAGEVGEAGGGHGEQDRRGDPSRALRPTPFGRRAGCPRARARREPRPPQPNSFAPFTRTQLPTGPRTPKWMPRGGEHAEEHQEDPPGVVRLGTEGRPQPLGAPLEGRRCGPSRGVCSCSSRRAGRLGEGPSRPPGLGLAPFGLDGRPPARPPPARPGLSFPARPAWADRPPVIELDPAARPTRRPAPAPAPTNDQTASLMPQWQQR